MHEFLLLTITPVVWLVAPVPIRLSAAPTASSQDMEGLQRAMKKNRQRLKFRMHILLLLPTPPLPQQHGMKIRAEEMEIFSSASILTFNVL